MVEISTLLQPLNDNMQTIREQIRTLEENRDKGGKIRLYSNL